MRYTSPNIPAVRRCVAGHIFSHPDCTVGTGIAPVQQKLASARGLSPPIEELHLALKILWGKYMNGTGKVKSDSSPLIGGG